MSRTAADRAQLALLLEVAATPTIGNVDRHRDLEGLHFERFLAGAIDARPGLEHAAGDGPLGRAFLRAVDGMAGEDRENTQFGCLLLLVPLVRAATRPPAGRLSPADVRAVVEATTVEDAADFYRAFDRVDVAVEAPPTDAEDLDVRRGSAAIPALRERGLTLGEVLALGADRDDLAREWVEGFPRSFGAAQSLEAAGSSAPILERAAAVHLELLAGRLDTHVVRQHGPAVAEELRASAARLLADGAPPEAVERTADASVADGINPGTTADLLAAGLYIALERGVGP